MMRKLLIVGAGIFLMSAPVFAQGVTTETTTRRSTETVAPAPVIVHPAPGATYEQRTITQSGSSGESRTDKRSDTYVGADGAVHKDQVIRHESAQ
jgi:hypothetical protein